MSRRSRRVTVNLDAKGLQELSQDDRNAVLRGADDIIAQGGRTLLLLLDKIEATGDPKFIPALKAWNMVDYKKVQQRIAQVIRQLEASGGL